MKQVDKLKAQWKSYKLSEICSLRLGKTPSTKKKKYWCTHEEKCDCFNWYVGKDIAQGNLETERKITWLAVQECKMPLASENSVLYSNVRYIRPLYPARKNISFSNHIFCLEPKKELIESNYLFYYLQSAEKKLYLLRKGTVFPEITKSAFASFIISLPPLSIQYQILSKFQLVYNKIHKNEVVYNDNLLKIIQKHLEIGDLLFLKHKDSEIKVGNEFSLVAGKTPSTKIREYWENGTIKWINSGILTNLYFLTEYTPHSKLISEKVQQECKVPFAQPQQVLISDIGLDPSKIVWVSPRDNDRTHVWQLLGTDVWQLLGTDVCKNSTLFFALRQIDFKQYDSGSVINHLQRSVLMNLKIAWVSNLTIQTHFLTLLNSSLAKIKDLHSKIKDLHSKIKDLLLLKYFPG